MNKVPLSVVMITKNEAHRMEESLKSVDWADEIVIVDDHSTDNTVEIARKYTDKIFERKWTWKANIVISPIAQLRMSGF